MVTTQSTTSTPQSQPPAYNPQFQPPTWQDNVDLVAAEGPNGLNAQFQNLRAELDMLSSVIQQLSKQINSAGQTATTANTTNAAQTTATAAQTTANAAQTTANAAQTTANKANSAIQAIIWGCIDAYGNILSSSGNFTVNARGAGLYDIRFNTAFRSFPAIQANTFFSWGSGSGDIIPVSGDTSGTAVVLAIYANQCQIKTSTTGNPSGTSFCFIAYCPPA